MLLRPFVRCASLVVKRSSYISTGMALVDALGEPLGECAGLAGLLGIPAIKTERQTDEDELRLAFGDEAA